MNKPFDHLAALDRVTIPPIIPSQARTKIETSERLREVIITFPTPMRRMGLSPEKARQFAAMLVRAADQLQPIVVVGAQLRRKA